MGTGSQIWHCVLQFAVKFSSFQAAKAEIFCLYSLKKSADGFKLQASIRGWKCLAWSVKSQFCNLDTLQTGLIHNPGIILHYF